MSYYAGLDVSLEETAICIIDETGAIVRELRAPSDPESLISAFNAVGLSMERIGLEILGIDDRQAAGGERGQRDGDERSRDEPHEGVGRGDGHPLGDDVPPQHELLRDRDRTRQHPGRGG